MGLQSSELFFSIQWYIFTGKVTCRRGGYEGPAEAGNKPGMMQHMSGALSPKGIIQSISAKGGELMQGRRGQGFLNNDVSISQIPNGRR